MPSAAASLRKALTDSTFLEMVDLSTMSDREADLDGRNFNLLDDSLTVWTFRTLNNTDLFVDRVGSIVEQPEVADAIGDAAAAELVDALDLEQRLSDALPEEVAIAAGPINNAAQGYN